MLVPCLCQARCRACSEQPVSLASECALFTDLARCEAALACAHCTGMPDIVRGRE